MHVTQALEEEIICAWVILHPRVLHLQSTAYESSTVDRMMIHWAVL